MAVVTKYGSAYRDPASLKAIEAINRAAEVRLIKSLIAVTNGDSSGSRYFVGSVPTNAKMNPGGSLYYSAITGVATAKMGFYYPNGGAAINDAALMTGQSLAAAGSVSLAAAAGSGVATPANMEKFVWQLAGLASDPGGELDIVLTTAAAATADGSIYAELSYAKGV